MPLKLLADKFLDEQCGFRPSRSTVDALVSLRLPCKSGLGQGPDSPLCMLDLAKAFDSVDKEMPWQILLSRGAPPKLVNFIRDLHTHHSPVICSKVDSAPQVLDSCRDVCLLHPYSISVVTQSFASYSCRGICYKIQGQIVHCKNLRC